MPSVTRISALSAISFALLAATTAGQDLETLRPVADQGASEPLPVETLLSLSSSVGGETPRWAPEGDRILLGGSNLRLIRAEGGAISELPVPTGGSGPFSGVGRAAVVAGRTMDLLCIGQERHAGDLALVRSGRRSVPHHRERRAADQGLLLVAGRAQDRVLRQSSRAVRRVDGGGPVRGGSPAYRRTRTGGLSRLEPRFRVCPVRPTRWRMDGPYDCGSPGRRR